MVRQISRLINAQRARTILECYGADPLAWPAEERQAVRAQMERNPELHGVRDQARLLDDMLHEYGQATLPTLQRMGILSARILSVLPRQDGMRFRKIQSSCYRNPVMTALLAGLVMLSVLIFNQRSVVAPDALPVSVAQAGQTDVFHDWAWEDVTGEIVAAETSDGEILPFFTRVADLR